MSTPHSPWPAWQRHAFRFGFLFLGLLALPLDAGFWRALLSGRWFEFQTLFQLTAFVPRFGGTDAASPLYGYGTPALLAGVALAGATVWAFVDRDRREYASAAYVLRVLLRYRLALGLVGFGVLKLFPLQFPAPTLSDLYTPYGDFLPWKIYYLTTAVAGAGYQPLLGLFELAAAALLLWRPTAVIGAAFAASILVNIVLANLAYHIGEHVYATALLLFALALLAHDAPRLYQVLVQERPARPDAFRLPFSPTAHRARLALRGLFAGFALVYGATAFAGQARDRWPFPAAAGVPELRGHYLVREFRLDGIVRPPSLTDPARWQNVVFEPWNTVSIRRAQRPPFTEHQPVAATVAADNRAYEHAGNVGRHFYTYTADPARGVLSLSGTNVPGDSLALTYTVGADGVVTLQGRDAAGHSLEAVLERADKRHLLHEGRRRPLSLY